MNARPAHNRWLVLNRTSVLIVGGGLAGLSMALFLSWHGVECILVEHHPDVLSHPRMRTLAPRLVEMYRPLGLEPRLRADGDAAGSRAPAPVRAETLAAEHIPLDTHRDLTAAAPASPCQAIAIDQDAAERVIRQRAVELGADVRFGAKLEGFTEEDSGVLARLRSGDGTVSAVAADYLIAADGAGSAIRERQGIAMTGPGHLRQMLSIQFEADLRPVLRRRTVGMAYVDRPYPQTVLKPHTATGRRWVLCTTDPGSGEPTDADCETLVHAALGHRLPLRLLPPIPGSTHPALRFGIGAAVAERFREGRIFLIGDAAHHLPPPGGFNGTTGVADAHNLAWKLAAVIAGHAKPALLDTYHAERRPVAEFTMRQALARSGDRLGLGGAPDPIVEHTAVMLGYRYGPGPITGAAAGSIGTRFPHLWLPSGESTIDLFGTGFVLLTGPDGEAWTRIAPEHVSVRRLNTTPPRTAADGAVLVRPDGFVAWRSPTAPADPAATLARVMAKILAGPTAPPGHRILLLRSGDVHSRHSPGHRGRHPRAGAVASYLARRTQRRQPRRVLRRALHRLVHAADRPGALAGRTGR